MARNDDELERWWFANEPLPCDVCDERASDHVRIDGRRLCAWCLDRYEFERLRMARERIAGSLLLAAVANVYWLVTGRLFFGMVLAVAATGIFAVACRCLSARRWHRHLVWRRSRPWRDRARRSRELAGIWRRAS
jgi:hypothetical protein